MNECFSPIRRAVVMIALALVSVITGCKAPTDGDHDPARPDTPDSHPMQDPQLAPTSTGYADVDSVRIYYQVYGDLTSGATPLLVLHGTFQSAEAMMPLVKPFAATRPVIAIDQRGHGRTEDTPRPITYERLADDAAGVLEALHVPVADVLGYSMGGTAAIGMAVRHPNRVGKLVVLSAPWHREGWYPGVLQAMGQMTPEAFDGSPLQAEYERLSPTPDAFPTLVEKMRDMEGQPYGWAEDEVRVIAAPTMIVIGDTDGVELEHAMALFRQRGGADPDSAASGFLTEPPRARLAVLPATSHTGVMAQGELIAELVMPFLDDAAPPIAKGFK